MFITSDGEDIARIISEWHKINEKGSKGSNRKIATVICFRESYMETYILCVFVV